MVKQYRSINRAYKRGHIAENGMIIPKRPFNNRSRDSRPLELLKEKIYERIKSN